MFLSVGARRHPVRVLACAFSFIAIPVLVLVVVFSPANPFAGYSVNSPAAHPERYLSREEAGGGIWRARRSVEWRPCRWWQKGIPLAALPAEGSGYIRVDCYGGLNQMRRDFCDGIGIARLLNATLVLPKFEVAAYWNESSRFEDMFDVDYFIEQTKDFIWVVRELPEDIKSREPFRVDCSKRKGQFDYVEHVLPSLLEHRYISITPAMSQRRDREKQKFF